MFGAKGFFVGRAEELAHGERAIAKTLAGEGALLLFSGEAGLGKTRLAQAIANSAAERGARVVWGRAWEAGGAPSYWPWIQVFRALGSSEDPFRADAMSGELELPRARFAKFDAATSWLKGESKESALVIVLDDLHAADLPTLLFLHFLVRDRVGSRLLIVGTYREVEARLAPEVGALLTKVAREGDAVPLDRLSQSDVLAWICATSGEPPEAAKADADRLHAITEGNALFVDELLRVRGRRDAIAASGLRAVLDEHLGRVTAETRAILEAASVLGRDIDPALVANLSERPMDDIARALREARDVGLLIDIMGGERLSFGHMLIRERLYTELLPSRRAALHAAAAEAIITAGGDAATAAHHHVQGSCHGPRVAENALVAGRTALARLAFEEVARLCQGALTGHACDDDLTVDLELLLGEALMRSGKVDEGRDVCAGAAHRAKRIGSTSRQAEAALAYGTELMSAAIDERMVAILDDALSALPADDSPLRARVFARLAAALVPPRGHEEAARALDLARTGIEMARRTGDLEALLYSLHYGNSAMGYLITSAERHAQLAEMMSLAKTLNQHLTLLTISGWWSVSIREHGTPAEAARALAAYEKLIGEFPQPYYQWRVPMLRAMVAGLSGDLDEADRLADDALAIAQEHGVNAGRVAWLIHRFSMAHLRGEPHRIVRDMDMVEDFARRASGARAFLGWAYAAAGRSDEARKLLIAASEHALGLPICIMSAEAACMLEDKPLAAKLYPFIGKHARENPFFWGPYGTAAFGPTPRVAGDVARLLGRAEEARSWYELALTLGRRIGAPAMVTLTEQRLASLDASDGKAPVSTAPSVHPKTSTSIASIDLQRDGEMWRVSSSTGVTMHLKDSKGLAYLSHLLGRPEQSVHVTELADLSTVSSDAGNVLDARAKIAYKSRLEALREQLEEAESFSDTPRATAVQAEIETLAEQLAGAVGLGGRDRKLGSQVEKVRINVQRRIRDAIERIEEHDPALGRYLAATVKTGSFCMFAAV